MGACALVFFFRVRGTYSTLTITVFIQFRLLFGDICIIMLYAREKAKSAAATCVLFSQPAYSSLFYPSVRDERERERKKGSENLSSVQYSRHRHRHRRRRCHYRYFGFRAKSCKNA